MSEFPEQIEISLGLESSESTEEVRARVAEKLGVSEELLPELSLIKRSLDARRGRVQFHLLLSTRKQTQALGGEPPREVSGKPRVIIVGDGPAGLFCAYQLARARVPCVVIDRGKPVQPRRRDLKLLNARGEVNHDSNYCFGEGGAGTYSDGKLYTRSHKRGPVRDVMELLVLHGAPESVLTEARPHIGSNLLPEVISALRQKLEEVGVEFRFGARLTQIYKEGSPGDERVSGIGMTDVTSGETSSLGCEALVLATGHSARDVFELLHQLGVTLEPKGFALGVRIEHPQPLINQIQFGRHARHEKLGAAAYKLATQVADRGVFSFCMCPGGWIVPAMTDDEHLVVNGMSLSKRDSAFANSGLVVAVEVSDWEAMGLRGPLGGIELQKRAERAAREAGGGANRAPATRVTDFLCGRASSSLPESSYLPGLSACDVGEVLEQTGLSLAARMREAFSDFEKRMRGYKTEEAVLVGVESRTSSPVRVVRHPETLVAPGVGGLYPCGEGAGYAGGIVSAAVDGARVADRIVSAFGSGRSSAG